MQKSKYLFAVLFLLTLFVVYLFWIERQKRIINSSGSLESSWIAGGIVPHHLLVENIINNFFEQVSAQNPKTIILIGPNHLEKGSFGVLSSLEEWGTPTGTVSTQTEIINGLLRKKLIKLDGKVLSEEFSITGIVPIIKKYLPQVKVVPLVLSGRMKESEVLNLADELARLINKETILIASIDFSHYLTSAQAEERDRASLELINNHDYKKILTLNSEYLDSPPALVVLLKVMKNLGKTKMKILDHTNSGIIMGNGNIQTTSYFSITFF